MEEEKIFTSEGIKILNTNLSLFIATNLIIYFYKHILGYEKNNYGDFNFVILTVISIHIFILLILATYYFVIGKNEIGKYMFLSIVLILIIGFPACIVVASLRI